MKNLISRYYIRNAEGKFLYYCHTTGATYFCNDIEQAESYKVYEHALNDVGTTNHLEIVQVQLTVIRPMIAPKRSILQALMITAKRIFSPKYEFDTFKSLWEQQDRCNKSFCDVNENLRTDLDCHNRRLDLLESQIHQLQEKLK